MKHLKIILFVIGAMSLTTCTSVHEEPQKIPVEKKESKKVYYTLDEKENEQQVQTGEINSVEQKMVSESYQ